MLSSHGMVFQLFIDDAKVDFPRFSNKFNDKIILFYPMHYATLFFTFAAIAACVCGKKAKPRVVVVGAGFAGLGAATTLESKGFAVTVLEARSERLVSKK